MSRLNQLCLRCLDTTRNSLFFHSVKTSSGICMKSADRADLLHRQRYYIVVFSWSDTRCAVISTPSPLRPCRRQFPRVMPLSKPGKHTALSEFHHLSMLHCLCTGLSASHVILASCCWVWAVDSDASPDREKSLELIRYLVPDVFNGALVDSLSGHALSAAGLAASFLLEANEQAQLTAPPTSICSVIKAQKPGWLLMPDPRESCDWKPFYIKCLSWSEYSKAKWPSCHITINLLSTI